MRLIYLLPVPCPSSIHSNNPPAIERLQSAYEKGIIKGIIGTDAVFWGEEFIKKHSWYREVSIAPLFARVIYNINTKQSVSELLK